MKKNIAILLLLIGAQVNAQNFYDLYTIQEIRIYFGFSNWDYRLDTAKAGSEGYLLADSVFLNGTKFLNCGVKYKGNSSYSANRAKNPLHIKLDYITDQKYQGYDDVKLGNGFSDNSMIREPLAYYILRQYMDAPKCNFAKVYINGNYYGIMSNAESIDKNFNLGRYFSNKYTEFKCNPQNAGPGSGNGSSLEYNGTTLSNYNTRYELESDTGWYELFQLCDTLNNYYPAFNSIADVDRFLWMLAFNNVLVNLDSYSGSFRQNYYLYRNHAKQWIPTVWDLNMSFGGFSLAGGITSNLNATTMQTMSHTLHKTESGWPLIYKLLNDPFTEKMYYAHIRTINSENFSSGSYKIVADSLHDLIDNAVSTDPNYLSTYANFSVALNQNTSGTGGGPSSTSPGIYPLMDARTSYLSNVLSAAPPVITNILEGGGTAVGTNVNITAQVSNASSVYLGYRSGRQHRFVRINMYDDGMHNDGASADGVFGASFNLSSLTMQYYIYAENASAGAFSPVRAEYELYEITPTITSAQASDLVINEIAANNSSGLENESGKVKDWIEIYNKSNQPLGLSGWNLSDSLSNLSQWVFPADAMIGAGEYLLVWADDQNGSLLQLHSNFNLNAGGESVVLSKNGTIADQVSFGSQNLNYSYSRCEDVLGNFVSNMNRTPAAVNDCSSAVRESERLKLNVYPNPFDGYLQIESNNRIEKVLVHNLVGHQIYNGSEMRINTALWSKGSYVITVISGSGERNSLQLIKWR